MPFAFDSDAGTITYTRSPNMLTNHGYADSTPLVNPDGTIDFVRVPIDGNDNASGTRTINSQFTPSYPPNESWYVDEISVSWASSVGASRSRTDLFTRLNGGGWAHWTQDPAAGGYGWTTTPAPNLSVCSGIASINKSTWVYGLDATDSQKIDSAVITVDIDALTGIYPELLTGSFVYLGSSIASWKSSCNYRLSGVATLQMNGGGEIVGALSLPIFYIPSGQVVSQGDSGGASLLDCPCPPWVMPSTICDAWAADPEVCGPWFDITCNPRRATIDSTRKRVDTTAYTIDQSTYVE